MVNRATALLWAVLRAAPDSRSSRRVTSRPEAHPTDTTAQALKQAVRLRGSKFATTRLRAQGSKIPGFRYIWSVESGQINYLNGERSVVWRI